MTTRRDFVALAASAAVVWPVAAPAQPGDGMRRLGVLMSLRADDPEGQAYAAALVHRFSRISTSKPRASSTFA
jgi:hypothetical protein